MKNLLVFACGLGFSAAVSAQDTIVVTTEVREEKAVSDVNGATEDVTTEKSESKSFLLLDGSLSTDFTHFWRKKDRKKSQEAHWSGFGFAFSNLDGLQDDVDLKLPRSYSFILNLGTYMVPIHSHWLLFTGLGLDFSRHHFKGNVGLKPVGNRTDFVFDPDVDAYKYSKFVAYYITIPVMLEYQTRLGSKTFFINGGVEGMIKYASEAETKGKVTETFSGSELSVLPLNYRFSGRVGIGHLAVFGYYQPLSPLEKGPDIRPYGIGLMLGF
ncbi:hypothetical protein SAMD00024442_35_3 [Candidatus Symbiothrix dinenymphae]|nr:hypothetical protein SAMD00024442_35_3 [Candidatus Symbiothrix dinenymphae]